MIFRATSPPPQISRTAHERTPLRPGRMGNLFVTVGTWQQNVPPQPPPGPPCRPRRPIYCPFAFERSFRSFLANRIWTFLVVGQGAGGSNPITLLHPDIHQFDVFNTLERKSKPTPLAHWPEHNISCVSFLIGLSCPPCRPAHSGPKGGGAFFFLFNPAQKSGTQAFTPKNKSQILTAKVNKRPYKQMYARLYLKA